MKSAFITAGGIGDTLQTLQAATLFYDKNIEKFQINPTSLPVPRRPDIYVNSHQEIVDFVNKCTYFSAYSCPERVGGFKDSENPLNLKTDFLDELHKKYDKVFAVTPDFLFQAPLSFPWFEYCKSYKRFMQTQVYTKTQDDFCHDAINPNTKNIFFNFTSVTLEKNYSLPFVQKIIDLFNKTSYNIIIARTSNWKGTPIPFFAQGRFYDLVDKPIEEVMGVLNKCDYFCGIDSAFSHISYHLGLPRLILQYQYNQPFHIVRYQNDTTDCIPLNVPPEQVFNRIMLNLRDPITQALPQFNIPYQTNTKQLLFKKYYD